MLSSRHIFLAGAGLSALALGNPARAETPPVAPATQLAAADTEAAGEAAEAAEAEAGPETIIVTARRRNENIQDVPLAVSAISGSVLTAQRLDRIGEFALKVPNFTAVQQNTRVSGLYIRGVGGNANNDGAEGGVGLIVDNVFFTHVGFTWLDFVDLESVEIVRGPQGTLLGKNTTIGAVIVRTQKPSFDPSFYADLTYGSYGQWQFRGNGTGALIDDKLAYRLTFSSTTGGGWVTNAFDKTKYLDADRWAIRGQLLFTPTDNFSDRLIAEYYQTSEYNNFYPPQSDVNFNLNLDNTILSPRPGSWTNKLISRFGYTPSFDLPNNANLDTQQRLNSTTIGVSNEFNWEIGSVTLTSVSAWRQLQFRPLNDSDGTPYPIFRGGFDVDVDQYSQELRLASASDARLQWTIGGYYLHEDLTSTLRYAFYRDATKFLVSPTLPAAVLQDVNYSKAGALTVDSGAVFGQATWRITDALLLTGGIRYTNETKSVDVTGATSGGVPLPPALAPVRAATLASFGGTTAAAGGIYQVSARENGGAISWLVNPSYQINENFLLWASVSYGEKSGAANTTASPQTLALALTQPEKSTAYQAGIKTTWADKRIVFNLDIYRNDISGYQASQINPQNPAIGSILANVGDVRLQGVELDAAFYPARGLSINVSGAYNDATYRSYPNAPAPIEYQVALGGASAVLDLSGERVVGAPLWNGQGTIAYTAPVTDSLTFSGYVNGAYRSGVALINPRSIYGFQDAYGLVNAGITFNNPNSFWSVQLWVKNLADTRYAIGYGAATATGPVIAILGEPRRVGLTLAATIK